MNENKHNTSEQEAKALDTVINILLLFLLVLVGYGAGYYIAMREVSAHAGTIVSQSQGVQQ
jgi:hypothetical protein